MGEHRPDHLAMILVQYIGTTAAEKLTGFDPKPTVDVDSLESLRDMLAELGQMVPPLPYYYIIAAFGIIALLIHKWWFRPSFKGCTRLKNFGEGLKMFSPLIIYALVTPLLVKLTGDRFDAGQINLGNLGMALMAGITEEVIFRAIPG